ncbi:MAG TPA: response regulator, partial [Spirochaetia bacterium]
MEGEGHPTIFVVDDEPYALRAICRLLESAGYEVRSFDDPEAFLAVTSEETQGCALLDVQMPGLTGLELQERLSAAGCLLPVVFLTGHGDVPTGVRAMKAGAIDFLLKPYADDELFDAVTRALARDAKQRSARRQDLELARRAESLTPREKQVFALVVTGMLNKQIAAALGTTEKTVKVHRARVMEKMQAATLADLVRMGERLE